MEGPDRHPDRDALDEIQDALQRLRRSSIASVPLVLLGLLATLIAAAVAIYFIIDLSARLSQAEALLAQSQTTVERVQRELETSKTALRQASAAAGADQSRTIDAALARVEQSEQSLEGVSVSIASASASIADAAQGGPATSPPEAQVPLRPARALPPPLRGRWFAVVGSYEPSDQGLANARRQAAALTEAGECVEIWRTNVSDHFAVVLNGAVGEEAARRQVRRIREAGRANDAFPQSDRGWERIERGRACGRSEAGPA